MITWILKKVALPLVLAGLIAGCASSGGGSYQRSGGGSSELDFEPSLSSETGLSTKKEKIEKLREDLMGIRLQIEERNKLLEELGSIKKAIGSDTLIDNAGGY